MGTDAVQPLSKKERISRYGEVFTPQHVVCDMCDLLEQQHPGCFMPKPSFLEPTCGDGAFVLEILRRKFQNCRHRKDFTESLGSVYAMEIQADNVNAAIENVTALCRQFFKPTVEEIEMIRNHIMQADSLKVMRMINDMNSREQCCPMIIPEEEGDT